MTLVLALIALQELTEETLAKWRDHVVPTAEELRWRAVPWRPTFWDGVVEAHKQEKPVLLWAMNGHPLALC